MKTKIMNNGEYTIIDVCSICGEEKMVREILIIDSPGHTIEGFICKECEEDLIENWPF